MIQGPCRQDCPKRNETCHCEGNCPEYDAFVEANKKKKAEKHQADKLEFDMNAIDDRRSFLFSKGVMGRRKK